MLIIFLICFIKNCNGSSNEEDNKLNVSFNDCVHKVQNIAYHLYCKFSSLNIRELMVLSITDDHYPTDFFTLHATFFNTTMNYIPKLAFKRFIEFNCVNCEILELTNVTFMDGTLLDQLNISYNNITSLNANTFAGAENLRIIDLKCNKIEIIDKSAFGLLANLLFLDLSHNKIVSIEKSTFAPLKSLETLNVKNNLINALVESDLFLNNKMLSIINFSENKIETIAINLIKNLNNLRTVNFRSNLLKEFVLEKSNLMALESVDVSRNLIQKLNILISVTSKINASFNEISEFYILNSKNLTSLQLNSNKLENLYFLKELINLNSLNLSNNKLSNKLFQFIAFLKDLQYLYLQNVGIKSLNYTSIANLKNLQILDISYNNLKSIDYNRMSLLSKLTELFIDGNNLTRLNDFDHFEIIFPSLKLIGLTNNAFSCDHVRAIFRKFRQLDVNIYVELNDFVHHASSFGGIACIESGETGVYPELDVAKAMPDHQFFETIQMYHAQTLMDVARSYNLSNTIKNLQNEKVIVQNNTMALSKLIDILEKQIDGRYEENYKSSNNILISLLSLILLALLIIITLKVAVYYNIRAPKCVGYSRPSSCKVLSSIDTNI